MKIEKWAIPPMVILSIGIIGFSILFIAGFINRKQTVRDFSQRSINGIVRTSSKGGRGTQLIEIEDEITDSTLIYCLPLSWFFTKTISKLVIV
jgi:hypothetical protein